MKKLILLHTLLFSAIAHAILDTNNNGLSDLWEKQYNDGQLFSPTNPEHLPNADPDLDGWDNRTEAAAGTDPSLANPPEGVVATTLLPSATAGAYTLTWPTRIGKRYQLQASSDLENWLPVGEPIIAENTSHSIGINVTEPGSPTPPKLFWHITIDDIDSDSDGLTNNEEHQLATDSSTSDSDGDTISDYNEVLAGTDPNNQDTDADGAADAIEFTRGSDPKSADSVPPCDPDIVAVVRLGHSKQNDFSNVEFTTSYLYRKSPGSESITFDSSSMNLNTLQAGVQAQSYPSLDAPLLRLPIAEFRGLPTTEWEDGTKHYGPDLNVYSFSAHLSHPYGITENPSKEAVIYSQNLLIKNQWKAPEDTVYRFLKIHLKAPMPAPPFGQGETLFTFQWNIPASSYTVVSEDTEVVELKIDKGEKNSSTHELEAPAAEPGMNHLVGLLPVEFISDLNNDGQITTADHPLRDAALASGATDEIKDKGTEFIFHNDTLSNGIWDKEDTDPAKPATAKDDDDAEEITIKPGITEGEVWLEHPAIAGLSFYKSRECNAVDKVNLSPTSKFTVSASNPFPAKLFMRADIDGAVTYPPADPQLEGDMVLKIKVGTNGQVIDAMKMKLTVVKALGAKKYFHAARDYIFENNGKLCLRKEAVGNVTDPSYKRVVMMLQEKTEMKTLDTFHRNPKLYGIDAVVAAFSMYDVAVNGNFCFSSDPAWWSSTRPKKNAMTDKCHGRLISSGVTHATSSTGGTSVYESSIADFIGWNTSTGIHIQTGIVPVTPAIYTEALGGFGSNLIDEGGWHPWYGIANAGDKKVFFTATPFTVDGNGAGGRADLQQKLASSGCPALPGGRPGEIQCLYGDGGSSLALAYTIGSGPLVTKLKGSKHTLSTAVLPQQGDYFINTYLLFKSTKPR